MCNPWMTCYSISPVRRHEIHGNSRNRTSISSRLKDYQPAATKPESNLSKDYLRIAAIFVFVAFLPVFTILAFIILIIVFFAAAFLVAIYPLFVLVVEALK